MKRRVFSPVQTVWKWLPPVVVVTVAGLAIVVALHVNHVIFKTNEIESPASLSSAELTQCVQKAAVNGLVDTEALRACTERLSHEHVSADAVKTSIDELKWLLTLILSIAALFTVLQAAAAWFSATSYDRQANEKLKQIDDVQQSVRARYPLFEQVERARERAHGDLIAVLKLVSKADDPNAGPTDAISWLDNFYRDWDLDKRQRLLSVESFVSFDIDQGTSKDIPEDLKRFAVFYHAKYKYEKVLHVASFQDLERAENYLRLAIEKAHFDFTLRNELGNLYLTMWQTLGPLPVGYPDYLRKARTCFDESIDLEEKQQRAYYNLAVIANNYDHDYVSACTLLERALNHKNWQKNSTSDFLAAYIHYNLGCNKARILAANHTGPSKITVAQAEPCTNALEKAAALGEISETTVKRDLEDPKEGDLYGVYRNADPVLKKKLEVIQAHLISPFAGRRTNTHPQTFWAAMTEAAHLVWASITKSG